MSNMPTGTVVSRGNISLIGRNRWTGLTRAEANVVRLKEKLSKGPPPPTGDRLLDALAAIAFDADRSRARAWGCLANLRRHACRGRTTDTTDTTVYDVLAPQYELQNLRALALRRQRALRDDGAGDEAYRWHKRRAFLASWRSDDVYQLAKSREDEFANESDDAASTRLVIEAARLHARSDAWFYISKLHEARAMGEQPDADTIVELRGCRAEIAGLNAMLRAAEEASLVEHEAALAAERRGANRC